MAFNNPSQPSNLPIGMDLVELQDKMKFMPPQWLKAQVDNQTPAALPAALRLSELAGEEQRKQAAQAQGANKQPTVVEAASQQLGLGLGGIAPSVAAVDQGVKLMAGGGAVAPQQRPLRAPQQRPPMTPQLAQALQMAMAQRQGGQGGQGIKGLAKGGAIAFSSRGDVPDVAALDEAISSLQTQLQAIGRPVTVSKLAGTGAPGSDREAIRVSPEEQKRRDEGKRFIIQSELDKLLQQKASMGGAPVTPNAPTPVTKKEPLAGVSALANAAGEDAPFVSRSGKTATSPLSDLLSYLAGRSTYRKNEDAAAPSDQTKSAYGPDSGWAGVPSSAPAQERLGVASPSPAVSQQQQQEVDPNTAWAIKALSSSSQQQALLKAIKKAKEEYEKPPTPFSEADQNRIRQKEFASRQEVSKPYFDEMRGLIAKNQAAAANVTKGYNPLLEWGLTTLATPPVVGTSSLAAAGVKTLQRNQEMRTLEQTAAAAAIKAQGLMLEAELRDKRGDHEGAEKAVEAARKAQSDASTLARNLAKDQVTFANYGASQEIDAQNIARQLLGQNAAAQREAAKLAEAARKEKLLKPEEALKLNEAVETGWNNVRANYLPPQILKAVVAGGDMLKDPAVIAAVEEGKKRYRMRLLEGTTAYSPPSADDLLRQAGVQ